MTTFLLDTNIIIWWLQKSPRLTEKTQKIIHNPNNQVFVSSVSIFEIALKSSTGRLHIPLTYKLEIKNSDFDYLAFDQDHAEAGSLLPWKHKDPFDRMLMSQALSEKIPFITSDEQIWDYDQIEVIRA